MDAFDDEPLHPTTSEAVTKNVRVEVEAQYLPEHSQPFQGQWAFAYTVRITNEGNATVKLMSRRWLITDGRDFTREVKGDGVVGKQPILGPGESFEYTSWCPLATPKGVMRGTYQMVNEDGESFDVEIAPFSLVEPYTIH